MKVTKITTKLTVNKVYDSGKKLLIPLNLQDTYKAIALEAVSLLEGKYCSVFIKEDTSVRRVYASSPILFKIKPRRYGLTSKALRKKFPFTSKVHKANPKLKVYANAKTVISIPLHHLDETIGVLTVLSNNEPQYSEKELALLNLYGLTASLAIIKSKQYVEIESALKKRDMFVTLAGHELKNPLTVISSYSQLIQNKVEKNELPEKKWVNTLVAENKRLLNLIDELLQISRIKEGKLAFKFKNMSLVLVAEKFIDDAKLLHPDYPVIFKNYINKDSDIVKGDFNKLVQVGNNLINNAVKFSEFGSPIKITLKESNGFLVLTVRDKGIGIPKDKLPNLFREFYKVDPGKKGMGLGLFLTKTIVDKHKGFIKVASKVEKGTKFDIFLPKASNHKSKA